MKRKEQINTWIFILLCVMVIGLMSDPKIVNAGVEYPQLGVTQPLYEDEENNIPYLGEDQSSTYSMLEHWSNSKKGLQGNDFYLDPDYQSLGVKHVLLNIFMKSCITYSDGEYHLANKSYIQAYQPLVKQLNAEGISVTIVLLMEWPTDDSALKNLIYPGAREKGHLYYNLNCEDSTGKKAWKTIFEELVATFGKSDCHVDHWILGNEVNQTGSSAYNYTGSSKLSTNTKAYANVFKVLDDAIAAKYPSAKAYISFDHNWTATDTGLACKPFLDSFASYMGSYPWSVAWHPYAPCLDSAANTDWSNKVIWNSPTVTNNVNTKYICGSNLTVLTDYIRQKWGSSHRVILSEQGYDAKGSTEYQAAFWAYTYYAAQFNDMVDAVHFRAYVDHPDEGGLKFGLVDGYSADLAATSDKAGYIEKRKRPAYDVFKYMDTNLAGEYTAPCLASIGVKEWTDLLSDYRGPTSVGYWQESEGKQYFIQNNEIYTGWLRYGSNWYYLNPAEDGAMVTGVFQVKNDGFYCFQSDGKMLKKSWQKMNGNWYYLSSSGRAQLGWIKLNGTWYYLNPSDAVMVKGWQKINRNIYYFNSSGKMQSNGWKLLDENWYYLKKTGEAVRGWYKLGGSWYYLNPENGSMMQGWQKIGNKLYYLKENNVGKMLSNGWKKLYGTWYYFKTSGEAVRGWLKIKGSWYYLNPENGAMVQGWTTVRGALYYLAEGGSGKMAAAGWKCLSGVWYYFQKSGAAKTGWLTIKGKTYYLNPSDGAMLTGWQTIDGKDCYFNSSGVYKPDAQKPAAATEVSPSTSTEDTPGETTENTAGSTTENPEENSSGNTPGNTPGNTSGSTEENLTENPDGNTTESIEENATENPAGNTTQTQSEA